MDGVNLKFTLASQRKVGSSKFGGWPELPLGLDLPKDDDSNDIPFLCQINLSEFKNTLAPDGILYFFCQLDDTTEYGAVLFSKNVNSLRETKNSTVDTHLDYPLTERSIYFTSLEEVPITDARYHKVMRGTRLGGSILKGAADYTKEGRTSLLQINTSEIGELDGEVEDIIHFFIDAKDLAILNFEHVLITSQH